MKPFTPAKIKVDLILAFSIAAIFGFNIPQGTSIALLGAAGLIAAAVNFGEALIELLDPKLAARVLAEVRKVFPELEQAWHEALLALEGLNELPGKTGQEVKQVLGVLGSGVSPIPRTEAATWKPKTELTPGAHSMTPVSIVVRDLTSSPTVLGAGSLTAYVKAVEAQLLTDFNASPWVERGYVAGFAGFTIIGRTAPIPTGCWVAEFIDKDPNQPGALGYHEDQAFDSTIEGMSPEAFAAAHAIGVTDIHSKRPRKASQHSMRGLAEHPDTGELIPVLKILVNTTLADGASVSEVFSHEALEALVDPFVTQEASIRKYLDHATKRWVIGEIGDPVQGRGYTVAGVTVADFVYPSWFGLSQSRSYTSCAEQKGTAPRVEPFALAPGGYMSVAPEHEPDNWSQVFG